MIKRTKEWWKKFIESDDGSECGVGSLFHSSNACHVPGCEVCGGNGPCWSPLCEICYPDGLGDRSYSRQGMASPFRLTVDTPTQEDLLFSQLAAKVKQTGFDLWLDEQLKNPVFKREYERSLKEIKEYDRRENERREIEAQRGEKETLEKGIKSS